MKFTCITEIYAPRKRVVDLWKNPDNLQYWQDGFQRYELVQGKAGQVGSKMMLHYVSKKNTINLEETVLVNDLPDIFEGEYRHVTMTNQMKSTFVALDANTTIWKAEIHYTQFNGFAMKLFGFIGKRIFKKQTQKWLDNFKSFVEAKQH